MTRRVEWADPTERDLRRLDPPTRQRVRDEVERFAATSSGDVRRLRGLPHIYRLRVGDWRVIFEAVAGSDIIRVLRVHHRSQAYR